MKNKKIIVIVPARGGSKRIPKKNIKYICGQPMIFWPLMELSKQFKPHQIIISSDDKNILSLVESKGIQSYFIRPANLSDDFVGTVPVAQHALNWYESNVEEVEYAVVVYPTAVLLDIKNINSSIELLMQDKSIDFITSVNSFPSQIQRELFINKDGYAEMFEPENYLARSQDLIESMHDAGQFYVYKAEALRKGKTILNSSVKTWKIDRDKVIDIDTAEDFQIAENKMIFYGYHKYDKDWKF